MWTAEIRHADADLLPGQYRNQARKETARPSNGARCAEIEIRANCGRAYLR